EFNDHIRLSSMLVQEFKKKGAPNNLIKFLEVDPVTGKFKVPLSFSPYRVEIENTIASIINKRLVSFTSNGGSFIQVSSVGLNKFNKYSEMSEEAKNGGLVWGNLTAPRLIGKGKDKKLVPGTVLLPHWF